MFHPSPCGHASDVATVALTPGEIAPEMCEPDTPRRLSAFASVFLLLSEKHEIMM